MSAISDKARNLARIAAVQAEMVKLAEWKLAAARRTHDGLEAERRQLADLVGGEEALGEGLARAALRTAKALDGRLVQCGRDVAALDADLQRLRRRDKATAGLADEAKQAARREAEGSALETTMEAWLARASLP